MKFPISGRIDFSKMPSRMLAYRFMDELVEYFFPVEANAEYTEKIEQETIARLNKILGELLEPLDGETVTGTGEVMAEFFKTMPAVYEKLIADADLFLHSDPAAEGLEEVIIAYPGFYAITVYRVAHELSKLNIPILPRLLAEYAHTKTGIDIHPGAVIGSPFFIDHGTGVVIGQTTVIGNRVKIYQGVTLGALAVRKEGQGTKRHPTIGDNVILYAGSCILGGDTVVGHDSVIGGNVWLTKSVQPYSIVYHKSDVRIRDKSEMGDL